jgi:hypothetical protein
MPQIKIHPLVSFSVSEKLSFVHWDAPRVCSQTDFAALYVRKPVCLEDAPALDAPMSALGQKQTSAHVRVMSAYPQKRTSSHSITNDFV